MFPCSANEYCGAELSVSSQWQNLSLNDENASKDEKTASFYENKAFRMMSKMGYKSGSGLGKHEQGVVEPVLVNVQKFELGKRGLGFTIDNLNYSEELWDFSQDNIEIKEELTWLENRQQTNELDYELMKTWIKIEAPKESIENEFDFCDKEILSKVLKAKDIFNELDLMELCQARSRANAFETIRSVFFMNRAALKMANIDAATDFMFTNVDKNPHFETSGGPFYFTDVCAGPGGFTEYILWRKKWLFKGFGLTLRESNDFKVKDSTCVGPETFQAHYGARGDGDVCSPENIEDFKRKVLHQTDHLGVHFMMSDGGFSVEGNENLQEVLSKNIYICQCLLALETVREHGHFVTKLFDTFTLFSVGLLHLMSKCFERIAILKPNSSRPANSERYFVCCDLRKTPRFDDVKRYLREVVLILWQLREEPAQDVTEIVPLDVIKSDREFYSFVTNCNDRLGKKQIIGLEKLAAFCRNPKLVEFRQEECRKKCLEYWKIPDRLRAPFVRIKPEELILAAIDKPELILVQPREVDNIANLRSTVICLDDWHFCPMYCSRKANNCNFFAGVGGSSAYKLQRNKWVKTKNLHLVSGTILYGELVKENFKAKVINTAKNDNDKNPCKLSLHVIDAIRLGDFSLADLRFNERAELIETYCQAVNHEFSDRIRIRHKKILPLSSPINTVVKWNSKTMTHFANLPVFSLNKQKEFYDVNSILLLKTNDNQSFQSTYVLRVQIFIDENIHNNEKEEFSFSTVQQYLKEKILI